MQARENKETTTEKTSEKTSEKMIVTSRTIEHDLAIMKKIGILSRVGGRKTGHWEVVNNNETK